MIIRKFKDTDAKDICKIIKRNDLEVTSKYYPKKVIDFWTSKINPLDIIEKSKTRACFVATLKKKVVGYISLEDNEIKKLFVNPGHHKLGMGKELINHIIEFSEEKNLKNLIVKSTIYAESFYKKFGFKKIRFAPQGTGEIKFKLILMEKKLK